MKERLNADRKNLIEKDIRNLDSTYRVANGALYVPRMINIYTSSYNSKLIGEGEEAVKLRDHEIQKALHQKIDLIVTVKDRMFDYMYIPYEKIKDFILEEEKTSYKDQFGKPDYKLVLYSYKANNKEI